MTDLDKLIEAVEGGVSVERQFNAVWNPMGKQWVNGSNAMKADDGSLDAARALHEALLPGWEWDISWVGAMVGGPDALIPETSEKEFYVDNAENPARAWLIAILKAYRSAQNDRSI